MFKLTSRSKPILSLIVFTLLYSITWGQNTYLLTGSYDSPQDKGIHVYRFNEQNGSSILVSKIKTSNASYLTVSPDERYVFAVNENADGKGKGGTVTSFWFDKNTGALAEINQQPTEGSHPCNVVVDKTGNWLMVSNYTSGNFSLLRIGENGNLQFPKQTIQITGSSVDTARQRSPHVHGIFFASNNKDFYVTDLGTDKIMHYRFNTKKGKIKAAKKPFVKVSPGSGPRHLAFGNKEKFAYLLQEITGTVTVFAKNKKGDLKIIQTVSSTAPGFTGFAGSADIHISPDGKFLYASNRGDANDIAIYKIDALSGTLTTVGFQSAMGKGPRNFSISSSGEFLLVANQSTNNVVVFKRDMNTGLLNYSTNMIAVDNPVCLKWIYQ